MIAERFLKCHASFATRSRAYSYIRTLKKNCDIYLIAPDTRFRVVNFGDSFYVMDTEDYEKYSNFLKECI